MKISDCIAGQFRSLLKTLAIRKDDNEAVFETARRVFDDFKFDRPPTAETISRRVSYLCVILEGVKDSCILKGVDNRKILSLQKTAKSCVNVFLFIHDTLTEEVSRSLNAALESTTIELNRIYAQRRRELAYSYLGKGCEGSALDILRLLSISELQEPVLGTTLLEEASSLDLNGVVEYIEGRISSEIKVKEIQNEIIESLEKGLCDIAKSLILSLCPNQLFWKVGSSSFLHYLINGHFDDLTYLVISRLKTRGFGFQDSVGQTPLILAIRLGKSPRMIREIISKSKSRDLALHDCLNVNVLYLLMSLGRFGEAYCVLKKLRAHDRNIKVLSVYNTPLIFCNMGLDDDFRIALMEWTDPQEFFQKSHLGRSLFDYENGISKLCFCLERCSDKTVQDLIASASEDKHIDWLTYNIPETRVSLLPPDLQEKRKIWNEESAIGLRGKKRFRAVVRKVLKVVKGLTTIRKHGYRGLILQGFYWLEATLPEHAFGFPDRFKRQLWVSDSSIKEPFDCWRKRRYSLEMPQQDYKVHYCTEAEQSSYQISFGRDDKGNIVLSQGGTIFQTLDKHASVWGMGAAGFIIGADKKWYIASHQVNVFHHSSACRGEAVIAAGEIKTDFQGHIREISNKSGHYMPGFEAIVDMFILLQESGVDLSLVLFFDFMNKQYYNAKEYFESTGTCSPLSFEAYSMSVFEIENYFITGQRPRFAYLSSPEGCPMYPTATLPVPAMPLRAGMGPGPAAMPFGVGTTPVPAMPFGVGTAPVPAMPLGVGMAPGPGMLLGGGATLVPGVAMPLGAGPGISATSVMGGMSTHISRGTMTFIPLPSALPSHLIKQMSLVSMQTEVDRRGVLSKPVTKLTREITSR